MIAFAWCLSESTPFCVGWLLEKLLIPALLASLVAVFAVWQITKKRASDYASEQLAKFYAPMLGKLSELAAHRSADETVKAANEAAHTAGLRRDAKRPLDTAYVNDMQKTTERVEKFFEETLPKRFTHERVPLYVAMRQQFTENLAYADEDTRREFYDTVYQEVEKMRVYRDAEGDYFLPKGREILAAKVDMSKLDAFQKHVALKVEALKRSIKG